MKKIRFILLSGEEETPEAPFDENKGEEIKDPSVQTLKNNSKENEDEEELISLTKSQLAKLLGGKDDRSDLKELVEAIKDAVRDDTKRNSYGLANYDLSKIPEDDYLQVPDIFFTHDSGTTILDDFKYNKMVPVPFGVPIKFKLISRKYTDVKGSKNQKAVAMSAFYSYSKTVSDFIRNHSLFGIRFFENKPENKKVSSEYSDALITANNMISRLTEIEIKTRAINLNVKIDTMDSNVLRKKVVEKIASDLMKSKSRLARKFITEMEEDNETLEKIRRDKS